MVNDPDWNAIAARFGATATGEWQVLLNQFTIGEGFALIALSVPDRSAAALCRRELEHFLGVQSLRLAAIEPDNPAALQELTATLLALPADPGMGAVWISGVRSIVSPEYPEWRDAWAQALNSLNQQRNPFRARFSVPVIFVGAPWVVALMRETAPDLWSVRALSLRIETARTATQPDRVPAVVAAATVSRIEPEAADTPDLDLALGAVRALRNRPGQERALATALTRAAAAHAGQYAWLAAATAWREAADLHASLGAEAEAAYAWTELGDVLVVVGDLPAALDAFRQVMAIRERLARQDQGNAQWQRDLSISHSKIGDVLVAQGDLPAALDAFRQGMAIRERLVRQDQGNAQWQRDLSISHDRVGDVLVAQGDLPAALDAFRQGMAISERLARQDQGNAQWQRDLSISHNKIGEVLVAQGDLPAALDAFRQGMAISERLARQDQGNAQWQRDVLVSLVKLADVAARVPDRAVARAQADRAVALARQLIARFPNNPVHRRDLPVVEALASQIEAMETPHAP